MKKESKAKSVVIAVIAIILALCAVGAVVGVGSNGFENWDPSSWFKPDETEDPITSDDDKPKVNTYDDIPTVINGLSLNMTDDRVHASSQTVANSNGGTDIWNYYTFSLDDKGLYVGSTEYNHDYSLHANVYGYGASDPFIADYFDCLSSENVKDVLNYNSAIWGEKCIFHNGYMNSGRVCHFYVYSCRIDDVCAYINGDTSVCHAKDNVLTIGISIKDEEIGSFVVDSFKHIIDSYEVLATALKGVNTADYDVQVVEEILSDDIDSSNDMPIWLKCINIDNVTYTGPTELSLDFVMTIDINGSSVEVEGGSSIWSNWYPVASVGCLEPFLYVCIFPYSIIDLNTFVDDSEYRVGMSGTGISIFWMSNSNVDFTISDVKYNG